VAIGFSAGRTSQGNNSIILNATGANLNQTTANTFTVKPVRAVTSVTFAAPTSGSIPAGFSPMYYNPTTGEIIVVTP
jgi:fructose-1-phosphate kinase PfkB-like protein